MNRLFSSHVPCKQMRRSDAPRVTLEPPVVDTDRVIEAEAERERQPQGLPPGYKYYETMLVVQPKLNEMEKDIQLGFFEKVLGKGKAKHVMKLDRGKHPLAYPMRKFHEAYYVLYSFAGPAQLPRMIQDWFNNPGIDSEGQFLRCATMKQDPNVPPPSPQNDNEDSSKTDSLWDL